MCGGVDLDQYFSIRLWLICTHRTGSRQEGALMFPDHVVVGGVITVMLMLSCFAGLGLFIWRDSPKSGKD